ncbi:MAG: thiolase family protein, partial [Solirubrobacteraceae bacterium]
MPEVLAQPPPADATLPAGGTRRQVAAGQPIRGASIGAVATALPATVVPNGEIAARLGVDDGWIESRTGIARRHVLLDHERLSDLAAEAGTRALQRAELAPESIDLLLVATTSQDEVMPNCAPLVAGRMGATRAAAIDVGAACTAYVAALALAGGQLESGRSETALVIGADALSRHLDPMDRSTAALF